MLKKNILFLGAGSGFASYIIKQLIKNGNRIWLADKDIKKIKKTLNNKNKTFEIDVTNKDSCELFLKNNKIKFDAVLAFSGYNKSSSILDYEINDWNNILNVNLNGAFIILKTFGSKMLINNTSGSIIFISSINANIPAPNYSAYCCSKSALNMLVKVAAMELAPLKINSISPGPIESSNKKRINPAYIIIKKKHLIEKRFTKPNDVLSALNFLLNDNWVTGQNIIVDGGISLNYSF